MVWRNLCICLAGVSASDDLGDAAPLQAFKRSRQLRAVVSYTALAQYTLAEAAPRYSRKLGLSADPRAIVTAIFS